MRSLLPRLALALALAAILPTRVGAQMYLTQWGTLGSGQGQLYYPFGAATDAVGNVYVADFINNRIQKFTSTGAYITQWGTIDTLGNGHLPTHLAVDDSGSVYVTNGNDCVLQKFTSEGERVTEWGSRGSGNGQFNNPKGVAVDDSGYVYVADADNNRIQKFTSEGVYVTRWGTLGAGNGQFSSPWGVAVDGTGNVYVVDANNRRIQKFTRGGNYLTQWAVMPLIASSGTRGVAVGPRGIVYVADLTYSCIQKFTTDGIYVGQLGSFGSGNGEFSINGPLGVATDASDNVYVVDTWNHRIQKFGYQDVGVPASVELTFALNSVSPNPSRGGTLAVTFALPSAAAASLELFDVTGRRVEGREVGSLGAGQHTINIRPGQNLAPGLYLVRLAQGASSRMTRVVVLE